MKKRYIDDIWPRALKTFVQAFLGVLVPELVALLQTGIEPGQEWVAIVLPIICASLASGISAAWNVLNNWLLKDSDNDERIDNNRDS